MRDCSEYCELICCLVDGELSDEERLETLAHIEQCPECRRVYEAFTALSGAINEDMVEPPAELYGSIMSRLDSTQITHIHRYRARVITWASAAAACVAVGFVVLGVTGNLGNKYAVSESAAAAPQSVYTMDSSNDVAFEESDAEFASSSDMFDYSYGMSAGGPAVEAAEEPAAGEPEPDLSAAEAGDGGILTGVRVAAGQGGLYYGLTEALVQKAGADEALILSDWDVLLELTDLINWGADIEGDAPDTDPQYTLELYDEHGYLCTVYVWEADGALICRSDQDNYYYVAAGTIEELGEVLDKN